jgi:hypothetical protein
MAHTDAQETRVLPPVPPTAAEQLAAIPVEARQRASYNLTYEVGEDGQPADVVQAMRLMRAMSPGQHQAAAAAPARPGKDRSSWPKALTDGFATWSLVASLFGFSAIGIILGAIHVSNAHKEQKRASSVAAWGIGIGVASAVAWTILIIVFFAAMAAVSTSPYAYPTTY